MLFGGGLAKEKGNKSTSELSNIYDGQECADR